jgi:hypothetical protein
MGRAAAFAAWGVAAADDAQRGLLRCVLRDAREWRQSLTSWLLWLSVTWRRMPRLNASALNWPRFKPEPMSQNCRDGRHNGKGDDQCFGCWCLCHGGES